MWKPDLCIYHGNCDDGFASATIARLKWPDLPCFGAMHNKPLPVDVAGKHVIMVDFSLKRDAMVTQPWASCIVLDHHKTAEAELKGLTTDWLDKFGAGQIGNLDGVHAKFDMTKSGAMMTWEFCFPTTPASEFVKCIQARDLWQLSREVEQFSAAVRSYPQDFEIWESWLKTGNASADELIEEGRPLIRGHLMTMAKILREKHQMQIFVRTGTPGSEIVVAVPAVNCPYHFASDAAHVLLEQDPDAFFGMAYFRRADGRWQFSLRSEDGRRDVSEVAKLFGGGGHRNSAGFDVGSLDELTTLPYGR